MNAAFLKKNLQGFCLVFVSSPMYSALSIFAENEEREHRYLSVFRKCYLLCEWLMR